AVGTVKKSTETKSRTWLVRKLMRPKWARPAWPMCSPAWLHDCRGHSGRNAGAALQGTQREGIQPLARTRTDDASTALPAARFVREAKKLQDVLGEQSARHRRGEPPARTVQGRPRSASHVRGRTAKAGVGSAAGKTGRVLDALDFQGCRRLRRARAGRHPDPGMAACRCSISQRWLSRGSVPGFGFTGS